MHVLRMLKARGYWKDASEGSSGGSGGAGDGGAGGSGGDDAAAVAAAAAAGAAALAAAGDGSAGSKPTDAEAKLLKEVMDKKTKLKDAQDQLTKLSEQLRKFDGMDADQIRAMLADVEDRKVKDLEAKGQWDALKKQLVDQHTKALQDRDALLKQSTESSSTLEGKIADLTVGNAFGQSKFIAENVALPASKARTLFGAHFEFDGEQVVAYDKPKGAATRAVLVDSKGDPLSFEAAIEKLIDADPDRDQLRKSKVKAGASSKTEPKAAGAPAKNVELTGASRIAAALTAARKK